MNFSTNIKNLFKNKDNLHILIYINIAVFLLIGTLNLFDFLFKSDIKIIEYLALPSNKNILKIRPWTIITYMFSQNNFIHLLFNLLIFYLFGKIFLNYLNNRQLVCLYVLGGLSGALFFIFAYNFIPTFTEVKDISLAIGASASIMSVVTGISFLVKNHKINLYFFGQVKIIYIAIAVFILDILSIPQGNSGGHIAHLGGIFLGILFATLYKKHIDITNGLSKFFIAIQQLLVSDTKNTINKKQQKTTEKQNTKSQEKTNEILDKIKIFGYSALSEEEKSFLFKK